MMEIEHDRPSDGWNHLQDMSSDCFIYDDKDAPVRAVCSTSYKAVTHIYYPEMFLDLDEDRKTKRHSISPILLPHAAETNSTSPHAALGDSLFPDPCVLLKTIRSQAQPCSLDFSTFESSCHQPLSSLSDLSERVLEKDSSTNNHGEDT